MGIVAAIARVRAGAKSAGLEGALNSLGAELKSEAIPGRLRDVAGRLAALLDRNPAAVAVQPSAVASLERALDQQAALRAMQAGAQPHPAGSAAGAVCPFTGLGADEMGKARPPAAAGQVTASSERAEPAVNAPDASLEQAHVAVTAELATPARDPASDLSSEDAVAVVPAVTARAVAPATSRKVDHSAAEVHASGSSKRHRAGAEAGSREKRKERLAGSAPVANTSGRSATRPAAKRPRSRAESTRKKT